MMCAKGMILQHWKNKTISGLKHNGACIEFRGVDTVIESIFLVDYIAISQLFSFLIGISTDLNFDACTRLWVHGPE